MMGYSKDLKSYQLFDLVKQYIIIKLNVIFDENISSISLFKYPSRPPYSDPFGIVGDTGSTISPMCTLPSSSTFILESTSSWSTPNETVTSLDHFYSKINGTSPTPYLPRWDVNMIEATSANVGDISVGW